MNMQLVAELSGKVVRSLAEGGGDARHADAPAVTAAVIPQLGLHAGVPALAYHNWAGASQSRLKVIRDRSPAHLKYQLDNPVPATAALILGAAVHTCVLEPDLFPDLYDIAGQCEGITQQKKRCSKGGSIRRERAWFCVQHDPTPDMPGDPIVALAPDEYTCCLGIRDSVRRHPNTRHLLEGECERSAVWIDKTTGVLCRGRFDDIARGIGAITDLKTTTDASMLRFQRSIYDYGYHIQAAHYLRGAKALGIDADTFSIIAAEKEPPYAVAVYELQAAAVFDGGRELDALLAVWAECEATGVWPCYPTDVVKVDLPKYAPAQINERIGEVA